jgi:hypothetical protein
MSHTKEPGQARAGGGTLEAFAQLLEALADLGPLRAPARQLLENEDVLLTQAQGIQTRIAGLFQGVTEGEKYLWTIDQRGVNIAEESTPFPTPRGNIVHTNLSSEAYIGGEAWFGPDDTVTINAESSRFGDEARITTQQWEAAIKIWENLDYDVNPMPFDPGLWI